MLNEMVSIVGPAPIVAAIGLLATLLLGSVFLALSYREQPVTVEHTPDCRKWQRTGTKDARCTAPHDTAWFGPRAEAELIQTFDHQIGTHHE